MGHILVPVFTCSYALELADVALWRRPGLGQGMTQSSEFITQSLAAAFHASVVVYSGC